MPDRTQPPPHGVSISPLWSILLASISKWTVIIARKKAITMLYERNRKEENFIWRLKCLLSKLLRKISSLQREEEKRMVIFELVNFTEE